MFEGSTHPLFFRERGWGTQRANQAPKILRFVLEGVKVFFQSTEPERPWSASREPGFSGWLHTENYMPRLPATKLAELMSVEAHQVGWFLDMGVPECIARQRLCTL